MTFRCFVCAAVLFAASPLAAAQEATADGAATDRSEGPARERTQDTTETRRQAVPRASSQAPTVARAATPSEQTSVSAADDQRRRDGSRDRGDHPQAGGAVERGDRPRGDNPATGRAVPRASRPAPVAAVPPPPTRRGVGSRTVYVAPRVYYYSNPLRYYPYGYGAFGLGYFYYDPYTWYPPAAYSGV